MVLGWPSVEVRRRRRGRQLGCAVALLSKLGMAQSAAPENAELNPKNTQSSVRVEPKSGPQIELPKAIETPTELPTLATGHAQVLLELEVSTSGAITSAKVLDGDEPFALAALNSIDKWRFVPAKRDGVPVPAKIRFVLSFATQLPPVAELGKTGTQSKPATKEDTAGNSRPTKLAAAEDTSVGTKAAVQAPIEVTVVGQRPEVALVSMGRADVEQMPGAFGDPFRAIEALAGVTPLLSGLPFFFIRGAPPGNQGYFVDGVRVPLLYHMAAGPGIIHPALVDRVDLYAGGYPAKYGRFAGAIVAAESRDPPPEYHVEGNIRLVDSGAYVTAPFLNGSVALGGRYSYTAAVVSLIAPNVKLDYWDYQVKTVQYLTNKDTIGIFAFGSLDLVEDKTARAPGALVGTEFHRVDLRYQRRISKRTRLRQAVTFGYDKTLAAETVAVRDRAIAARTDLEHLISEQSTIRVGADVGLDAYDVIIPLPKAGNAKLIAALPKRTDTVAGVWSDIAWKPTRNLLVVSGLRLDHYTSGSDSAMAIEPRVSAIYSLRKNVRIVHALGLAHQPPSFIVPIPGFQISGLRDGLQRALQSSAGVEADLPLHVNANATLFQNAFFNLTDQLSLMTIDQNLENVSARSRGRTFGMELSLRRSFSERIGGFFAYTLSKSWRSINGIRLPAAFDRRHVLQAGVAFNLGRAWRASARVVIYSGIPSHYVESLDGVGASAVQNQVNPEHLPRTPGFFRTDLRLQKRWPVGNNGAYWAFTVEALNATANKETVYQECSRKACRAEAIGPITIPSIGLEAVY